MKTTRIIQVGTVKFGGGLPVVLQSMAATKTTDIENTAETCQRLTDAGAGIVRVAVDTHDDAVAVKEIRKRTTANLSVDLQENYRLAEAVAPFVDKIRYNPGHLYHSDRELSWQAKVEWIVETARRHDCALRIGVNCGSLDPALAEADHLSQLIHSGAVQSADPSKTTDVFKGDGTISVALTSALQHAAFIDSLGFDCYCVSIKSSDPRSVFYANRHFAAARPDVPIHLGLTEAGLPPEGIEKTRVAMEPLLAANIGDTLRVSLTVPNERKAEEIEAGRLILQNVASGSIADINHWKPGNINIISCPGCSRVENKHFMHLAQQVRDSVTGFAVGNRLLTIAVMGCRVNGPGETDHADIGLWCGKSVVNLKSGTTLIGAYGYDEVVEKMLDLLARHVRAD